MSNIKEILLASKIQDVVNHSWEVLRGTLMEPEVPELWASAARIQGQVVLGVGVTTGVYHPNVITYRFLKKDYSKIYESSLHSESL